MPIVRWPLLLGALVEGSEGLEGGARGAPPEQRTFIETQLDHPLFPAASVGQAEDYEGEIPDASGFVAGSIHASLILEHLSVIGRGAAEL